MDDEVEGKIVYQSEEEEESTDDKDQGGDIDPRWKALQQLRNSKK